MNWIKNHRLVAGGIGFIVVLILGFIILGGGNGDYETITVERRDVVEDVRVSGSVEAHIVSDIGFEASGTVRDVLVENNALVYRGQTLARLSLGTLAAELQSAQAQVVIKRAQINNTEVNLDSIEEKQNTLVANAYSELLSSDLVAEAQSITYTEAAPLVSGRYTGEEGTYKLVVKSATQSTYTDLYVFGLEDVGPVRVSKTAPTPIGTRGLFVTFPETVAEYQNTIWYVDVPNVQGASYGSNYAAYQDALRERERALDDAQAELREQDSGASIAVAELAQAQAEVARIEALIAQRVLTAPFDGVITAIDINPGESVSAASPALSIISNDGFGIEIDVPEIDSTKVRVGNRVSIALEAIPNEVFTGSVVSINRTETLVDGVSVYEARIAFDGETDERIASGMTAEVGIVTNEKNDVLAVPARSITYREDGTPFVSVKDAQTEKIVERDIAVGLRGSDGFVEVLAGVSEGDSVVLIP